MEAAETVGEQCIVLSMYHVSLDEGKQPRCKECWDPVYKQITDPQCGNCLGTTFEGGVKAANRAWAIFQDATDNEDLDRTGQYTHDDKAVQIEAYPTVREHDFIVRVREWSVDNSPLQLDARYNTDIVRETTLRVGARYGQQELDKVAQTTTVHKLPDTHVVYKYVISTSDPILRENERDPQDVALEYREDV